MSIGKRNKVDGQAMDERTRQNLYDAGCSAQFAETFAQLETDAQRLTSLRVYRRQLLDAIHADQRKLESLDFLIYQIRTNKKEQA